MPTNRDLKLDEYEISKWRYRELRDKVRQYPEWVRLRNEIYSLSAPRLSDTPRGGAKTSTVERQADKAAYLTREIDDVDFAIREACAGFPGTKRALMANVIYSTPYERLNIPCGRRQFYVIRRHFFFALDRRLQNRTHKGR